MPYDGPMAKTSFAKKKVLRLLIADDSPELRSRVAEALSERPGIKVVGESGDVLTTLQAIDRLKPDTVLLDLRMPGGNGTEVLRQIGKSPDRPTFIVLTNYAEDQYRLTCQRLGADFFLDKSGDWDRLTDILARVREALVSGQVISEVF